MASYRKKGKKWYFRVSYKDEAGSFKVVERPGGLTKKEAQLAAAEFEKDIADGVNIKNKERLFSDYYLEWFETFKEGKFSIETDRIYRTTYNLICEHFEEIKLKDIDRKRYQQFINKYAENHSIGTVKKVNATIKSCFKDALHAGDIPRMPSYKITLSGKAEKPESEKYLNEEEAARLTKAVIDNIKVSYTSSYMILLGLDSGARFAELLGLTEDCIDFENNSIKIDKTWDYKHLNNFSTTKTDSSNRTLAINPITMNYLKQFIDAKKVKPINKLVFTDSSLKPISSNAANKALKRALKRAGIERDITFHGLRHTHGSLLLLHDTSLLYVSKRLGHSNMETTANVYSHLTKELNEKGNQVSETVMNNLYSSQNLAQNILN
ncbi:site-specific integrase [Candidatus Enterococcus clewellii]|uniref:Tyr recombinase domain-containing protein n=1 Tax=Candidatus Enterococcus clewellii TaxID=1834193 RepID=A0A242K4F4_9ENTE|nr:site-specific integrase [Enterococcus sp. 9E7_DIV0242]OTP13680.1 hypothetical protein A5888_003158 [Enterococcus sp. 9E7_DIV0242]